MSEMKTWSREELEKQVVGKVTAVTIPVNISISPKQRVLDLTYMRELLENAEIIAQQECYCRKEMQNCVEPMDGCLSLNKKGEEAIAKGKAKQITVAQALEGLERTNEAGLVHMAYTFTGKEEPEVICSCCSCCCDTLTAALKYDYPDLIFHSEKVAVDDEKACVHCGVCVDRCQFSAREMIEGELVYHAARCYGCGLCVTTCPVGAIALMDR